MAASESAKKQARKDLRAKIKLEKDFIRKLTTLNNKIIRKSVQTFARDGIALNAREFESQLSDLLLNQYERAEKEFSSQIRDELPKDLAETDEEINLIEAALLAFFAAKIIDQSQIITRTNQKNIVQSIAQSGEALREAAKPGQIITQREIAKTSGVFLRRKLKSRTRLIASTEIQVASEIAKATEAAVLIRRPLALPGPALRPQIIPQLPPGLPPSNVQKQWVTKGDDRVRTEPQSHFDANRQRVDIDQPYIVGGQFLNWPKDRSLGATSSNVNGCRCISIISRKQVLSARKAIFDAERIENSTPIG